MPNLVVFWLIIFVVLVIVEFSTMQLFSIWFAVGALAALLAGTLGLSPLGQIIVFILASAVLLAFTRPILQKVLRKAPIPTNSELDVGKNALVIESINNEKLTGRVNLNGVEWSARSSGEEVIPTGQTVVVDKIDGAKLFVSSESK